MERIYKESFGVSLNEGNGNNSKRGLEIKQQEMVHSLHKKAKHEEDRRSTNERKEKAT